MPKISLRNSVKLYGMEKMISYIERIQKEISGVIEAQDIEYIHRMRVSSRKLRSAMVTFKFCFSKNQYKKYYKSVKQLTQALGDARDFDVQIHYIESLLNEIDDIKLQPGLNRLLLRLRQKREDEQTKVIKTMDMLKQTNFLNKLKDYLMGCSVELKLSDLLDGENSIFSLAYSEISDKIDEVVSYKDKALDFNNAEVLHDLRIVCKKIRYTLELFKPAYKHKLDNEIHVFKKLQDILGNINDCNVWQSNLNWFIEEEQHRIFKFFGNYESYNELKPGLDFIKDRRKSQLETLFDEFVLCWRELFEDNYWEILLKKVLSPF